MNKDEAEAEFRSQGSKLETMKQARTDEYRKEELARLLDEPENITADRLAMMCVGIPRHEAEKYQRYWAEHQVRAIQRGRGDVISEFETILKPLGLRIDYDRLAKMDPKTMTADEVQEVLRPRSRTVYDSDGGVERHDEDCECGNCEADP